MGELKRCCKKGCKETAHKFSWLCETHKDEWEKSKEGMQSRELTILSTEPDVDDLKSDSLYMKACMLYKEFIKK